MKSPKFLRRLGAAALAATLLLPMAVSPVRAADTTPPAAPTNLIVSPGPESFTRTLVIAWTAPADTDIAYYNIYRSPLGGDLAANETTFYTRTPNAVTGYVDTVPADGSFSYRVQAVDTSGNKSQVSNYDVTMVDVNNDGNPGRDLTAPGAPGSLAATLVTGGQRQVRLTWGAPADTDVSRYLVYRVSGNSDFTPAQANFLAYVEADANRTLTDTVPADGAYTYKVRAQDTVGHVGAASARATVTTVDSTAPVIAITRPADGSVWPRSGSLAPQANVTDAGGGVNTIAWFLDSRSITVGSSINLANLAAGAHTFRVEATDRAGNRSSASTTFTVLSSDTAGPRITINQPVATTYPGIGTIRPDVQVADSGTGVATTRYFLDGSAFTIGNTINLAALTQGQHVFRVVATDRQGNQSEARVAFSVDHSVTDTVAPVITITRPAADATYKQGTLLVPSVQVTDVGAGVNWTKWYVDGREIPRNEAIVNLGSLSVGTHVFKAVAADKAGNVASASVRFFVGDGENRDSIDERRAGLLADLKEAYEDRQIRDRKVYQELTKLIEKREYLRFVLIVGVQQRFGISADLREDLVEQAMYLMAHDPDARWNLKMEIKKPKWPGHPGRGWGLNKWRYTWLDEEALWELIED